MSFKLYYQNKVIGEVRVVKEGLYYHVKCRFDEGNAEKWWLIAVCEGAEINLGACGAVDGRLGLDRYVSINTLHGDLKYFYICAADSVMADKPFMYIHKLESAKLEIKNGAKTIQFL